MELTGHKTRSVFDRYDIVNEADLREGVRKLGHLGRLEVAGDNETHGIQPAVHSHSTLKRRQLRLLRTSPRQFSYLDRLTARY